ncbi:serpin family protein [Arthrobacter sp. PM3]|uniref:serpin family protein n=1 Tax=Arthrobacter sp. PM3 TaxID=2017685 RepID=UPI000E102A14|nr:serpin family protein [Arthrobacter sp. PM3]AXJ09821.1 proteinase inhibitor I4 serpin [Arthrobacter sp. PM3]
MAELVTVDGVERVAVDRSRYFAELEAFRASARKLGEALLADGGEGSESPAGNVVCSAGGLLIGLAMLRAGASGESAAELDRVLGLPDRHRDEAMNALSAALAKYDGDPGKVNPKKPPRKPVMHAAQGLFVEQDVPTGVGYVDMLARHYGTGVHPVHFADAAATKLALDAWVNRHTGGRITAAPGDTDPGTTFSLLSTLYFAAAWCWPFDPYDTSDRTFTLSSGEETEVPTMHQELTPAYAEGPDWRAVDMPYAKGFVMRLVLPAPGHGPETITAEHLADIAAALDRAAEVSTKISLPRWDHTSSFDLRKVLVGLGLETTFTTTRDFDAIQRGLTITRAVQTASITVAEKGTVAAAVTRIDGMATGVPLEPEQRIDFDRPFRYEIVHTETGLPLVSGIVADPRP